MSFALTTEQFKNRTKTVTRRSGWGFLESGDVINGVEKAMGLKKGEKIKRLGQVVVVSTDWEPLNTITQEDVIKEGFPHMTPTEFVEFYMSKSGCQADELVNRIEYEYLEVG
jgi:hypothetical protein